MESTAPITNEMLYTLIMGLQEQMGSLRSEFHEFRQDVRTEFRRVDDRLERLETKMEKLYEERRCVTVSFTRAWAFASFFIAVFAGSTAFVIGKIVT